MGKKKKQQQRSGSSVSGSSGKGKVNQRALYATTSTPSQKSQSEVKTEEVRSIPVIGFDGSQCRVTLSANVELQALEMLKNRETGLSSMAAEHGNPSVLIILYSS